MRNIIRCPSCNAEYAPSEIYLPDVFLGKVRDIEKDVTGRILYHENGDMQLNESYVCDKCNRPFKIVAKVTFNTFPDKLMDFSEPYSTPLKKASLFMKED